MSAKVQARRRSKARALVRGEPVVRKVLAAAVSEVARSGYHALRIDDVAAVAGVNKTTIYRRWPTRQELVRDALLSITSEALAAESTGALRTDLLANARRLAALAGRPEYQALFRVFAAAGEDAELMAIVRSLREAFESVPRALLAAAEARGELAPGVAPSLLFDVLGAALNWWLFFEHAQIDEPFLEQVVDLLLRGALAPAPRDQPR